jgi:hypothetical protein
MQAKKAVRKLPDSDIIPPPEESAIDSNLVTLDKISSKQGLRF